MRWYEKNKARVAEARKDPENAERQREYVRAHRARSREAANAKSRESMRRFRAENPDANKASCATYHAAHRDEIEAKRREKWASDAEYREASNAARKAHWASIAPEIRSRAARVRRADHRKRVPWSVLLKAAEWRARKKGIPFELTNEWAAERWTGFCEVTGIPFVIKDRGEPGPKFWSPSIDQITPRAGYTPANCRFVLWAVNAFKGDGTDADMMLVAECILNKKSF